jgi:hypothetical protein
MTTIPISSPFIHGDELRSELERAASDFDWAREGIRIVDDSPDSSTFRAEPVTITLLGATAVVVLIRGLLNIINTQLTIRGGQKIVLVEADGRRMEFPASIPPEKIREYAETLKQDREIKFIELR